MAIIRNLTLSDWSQFQILELDTFENDPLDKETFTRNLEYDGFFGLYIDEKVLIGYLYCRIYGDYAHLHRTGVLSSERGKGYGSQLFEKAISYFEEHNLPQFNLFVETHNEPAIRLYRKYSLKIIFESWHFIINLEEHATYAKTIFSEVTSKELGFDDLPLVQKTFSQANLIELRGMLEDMKNQPTGNKFIEMFQGPKLLAVARFNKKFSGCRPFFITDIGYFDTFISKLIELKPPEKEYIRITFDDNDAVADLCLKRNYTVHHHLYKMTRQV